MVAKLNRLKSSLKQYAKKTKHERRISTGRTVRIEKMIHELKELSKEDKFSMDNSWKKEALQNSPSE